ncbi:MAG: universal stress protein [Chloroflexi bacterium]|nr:universal stress protein [Chloroflexota bacterium]
MFERVLVPLDGSTLAEQTLPYVEELTAALGSSVALLGVWERGSGQGLRVFQGYLERMAARMERSLKLRLAPQAQVTALVEKGSPAEEILRFAEEQDIDLIAMATHGRSGVSRWVLGSVAEKVVRSSYVPVLLVPPFTEASALPPGDLLQQVLVPLDGSTLGEAALPLVETLATKLDMKVVLLEVIEAGKRVMEIDGRLVVGPYQSMDVLRATVKDYLDRLQQGLQAKGVDTTMRVAEGDPAEVIVDVAVESRTSLIVMSTHGRTGVARWAYGSVADKVLHASPVPVMLMRPSQLALSRVYLQGQPARICFNCGRITWKETVGPEDRCLTCRHHLHTCPNCAHYDGVRCLLQRPEATDLYPGVQCSVFAFRENRVILR